MNSQAFEAGILPGRSVLRIDGAEARHFLHNLVTADIAALSAGGAAYAALLTPQGKILFDFFVFDDGNGFLVDCAASQKAELAKRLTLYRLRAKVAIADLADLDVVVSPAPPGELSHYRDPRLAEMGYRAVAPQGSLPEARYYDEWRIDRGLADSDADLGSGDIFPHEANFDQMGAVSFTKGCYVGQEVVSRMEHRGLARNRILPVRLSGPAPAKGSELRSGETVVGTLLGGLGSRGLALVRLDRLAAAGEPLLTEGVRAEVLKPRWLRYDVPGTKGGE